MDQEKSRYLKAFGAHLRATRNAKNMSMEKLAYGCGMEYRQIARIERGEINTGIYSLYRIARAMKIDPKDLLNFNL